MEKIIEINWEILINSVPEIIYAIIILFTGWFLGRIIGKITITLINRFNLNIKLIFSIVIPVNLFIVAILIFPNTENDYGLTCGAALGLSVGYLFESEYIKYDPSELNNKQKLINLVIGLLIVMVLYVLLDYLVPLESPILGLILLIKACTVIIYPILMPRHHRLLCECSVICIKFSELNNNLK